MLDDLDSAYGLLPGRYRGVALSIVDTSSEYGRRVLEYLFPGVDAAAYDDFGVAPSTVNIEALYVGDDYRIKARLLQAAFETPGPGLLIHPWLGPMSVIMEEPAQIRFSERELRVIRISARFKKAPGVSALGSLSSGLTSAISSFTTALSAISTAVSIAVLSTTRTAAAKRSRRIVASAASSIDVPVGARSAVSQIREALAASSPSSPVSYDDWVISAAAIVAEVSKTPAVATASTTTTDSPTAQALMTVGLSMASALIEEAASAPSATDAQLLLAAAGHFVAQAAAQSPYADFLSRQEALSYRSGMTSALGQMVDRIEARGTDSLQAATTAVVRTAGTLSAAIVSEVNEVIGNLPSVRLVTLPRDVDAWQVAQHLAGDSPSRIEAVYADIVARNDPRHPSRLNAGTVEFLEID